MGWEFSNTHEVESDIAIHPYYILNKRERMMDQESTGDNSKYWC